MDFDDFEKKLKKLIITNIGESALPGKIEYTTEPLVRMTNSKIDVEYYKKQDDKLNDKVKSLKNK